MIIYSVQTAINYYGHYQVTYKTLHTILMTAFILLLAGCASDHIDVKPTTTPSINVKQALYTQFSKWKSVKYQLGGLSKNGIDCSGFVYLTYLNHFSIHLPRTAAKQAHSGVKINSQANLKAGDLVFFKTGRWQKHVGIYLDKRNFLHVSTQKGVIISHLDNPYWKKRYWQAVRVLYL